MCWAGSEVLQAVDGWRNASAAECRHRRPERSSPTGTAVRSRSASEVTTIWRYTNVYIIIIIIVQKPVNCHCQLENTRL